MHITRPGCFTFSRLGCNSLESTLWPRYTADGTMNFISTRGLLILDDSVFPPVLSNALTLFLPVSKMSLRYTTTSVIASKRSWLAGVLLWEPMIVQMVVGYMLIGLCGCWPPQIAWISHQALSADRLGSCWLLKMFLTGESWEEIFHLRNGVLVEFYSLIHCQLIVPTKTHRLLVTFEDKHNGRCPVGELSSMISLQSFVLTLLYSSLTTPPSSSVVTIFPLLILLYNSLLIWQTCG